MQFKKVYYYIGSNLDQEGSKLFIDDPSRINYIKSKYGNDSNIVSEVTLYTVLHPLFIDMELDNIQSKDIAEYLYQYGSDIGVELIPGDDRILKDLIDNQDDRDFTLMGKFLNLKGYNCIIYPLGQDALNCEGCILWNNKLFKNIRELDNSELI